MPAREERNPKPPDQPPPIASRAEKEAHACAAGSSVMAEGPPRLRTLKNIAGIPVSPGPSGRADGATDGEVPGLRLPCGAARNPDVCWAAEVAAGRLGRCRRGGRHHRESEEGVDQVFP